MMNSMYFNPQGRMTVIGGPCQLESEDHALMMATALAEVAAKHDIPFVFKTSFDKANRTSIAGERGKGLDAALPIFSKIKEEIKVPILTDVHLPEQCEYLKNAVDIIQIPAFLCRQTDLLLAAAATGLPINVKKGQFLSPHEMQFVADKLMHAGLTREKIFLCERGTSFGYNNLVNDFKGLHILKSFGYPVIFDATHSVMQPGGLGGKSGGNREFVPVLARAAVSIGVAGLFLEVHDDPDHAPSDGPNMLHLNRFDDLLGELIAFDNLSKSLS